MKVLGIMGSPRIKGNTDLLLDEALKGAASQGAEVEKILADKLQIAPCKEYYACLKDGNCIIRDDMDDVYAKLLAADAIIIASPMFFYTVSAQLMVLISRCQALWARKYVLKSLDIPEKKGRYSLQIDFRDPRREENLVEKTGGFFSSVKTYKYQNTWLEASGRLQDGNRLKVRGREIINRKTKAKRKYTKVKERSRERIDFLIRLDPGLYASADSTLGTALRSKAVSGASITRAELGKGSVLRVSAMTGMATMTKGRYGTSRSGEENVVHADLLLKLFLTIYGELSKCRSRKV